MIQKSLLYRQQGFTLLESLIALIILSVGMLGIAALYVEGLKAGRTAIFRTNAVLLAADMIDRVRANPAARDDYELEGATYGCINGDVNCTATELAQEDRLVWESEVADRMPTGTEAEIDVTLGVDDPFDTYTITLTWPEVGYQEPLEYQLSVIL
ncbi:MAG: type IV pilus modification protein PilV [Gammaproteobacteria bacterium]|nr:type IV pilus modification protein PilV [Gammaproteobacteria bacterium]MCP4091096.1 type IV pilus modification protein PilV [Gammaproteobacteria bacterium]MCP4277378.1 type IV pilus modification protein PilV [Gammaproteobacteria bacterium]MCP4831561.1 type IV pilus modification protein PilV [Gammaproteobacteria bacterium]MCP4927784.1 type IV pilus modification protein PilV [Gammaproteobacteria bacterium]